MRARYGIPLTLGIPLLATAAVFEGFLAAEETPVIPSNDPNLLVEKIWNFDFVDNCLMLKFVPGTEKVIAVLKTGILRLYDSINSDETDYVDILNIRDDIWSFGDHGLMSMEFHPDWENGVQKLFILYTGEPKDVSRLPNNEAITPIRPPEWGFGPPGTTGYTWVDDCDNLDLTETGKNRNGMICEHPYYVDRVAVDMEAGTAFSELTLLMSACGSSSTHGPGHLMNINNNLVYGVGDGSQFVELDYGWDDDGCYDPEKPAGQGVFRAIRDDFTNGKIVMIPYELLDSDTELTQDDLVVVGKGVRQPMRMFYRKEADTLTIGDVGFGDGPTTERIFQINGVTANDADATPSFGWPCIEGVRSSILGDYAIIDSTSELTRREYLDEQGFDYCASTYMAAEAFIAGQDLPDGADPNWSPPIFEYRAGVLDPDYPDICVDGFGAITSVFYYEGINMPQNYVNKLIFSDYAKQCAWYFDVDPNTGEPDTTKNPKTLISGAGIVHLTTGPDGAMYAVDFPNARLLRFSTFGNGDNTLAPTPVPTEPMTAAPTSEMLAEPAQSCFDPKYIPEFEWELMDNGEYSGILSFGPVRVEVEEGFVRSYGYNGMLPGPLMRMKTCGTYHLTLENNLVGWNEGADGPMNSYHRPTETNLHLHGMHISGLAPGDDVFTSINPGEEHTYTYIIPCDHLGGTNWYHPHSHGSSSLQLAGGAAGMLIVEPNDIEAQDMPMEYQTMPEQYIFIQDFDPTESALIAQVAKDNFFDTNIENPFTLINGCMETEITVEEGQWMRLRMLHSGVLYGAVISITPRDLAAGQCDIGIIAKDGVTLAEVPRMLPDGNLMHFSHASRVDLAIRCPTAGEIHFINYLHLDDPEMVNPRVIGSIVVAESTRDPADALPVYEPCRPNYLQDLNDLTADELGDSLAIEVRQTINGEIFKGPDDYFHEIAVDETQVWSVQGSDTHPLHIHVNHMQLDSNFADVNNYVPGWNMPGDWLDTLHAPGNAIVRVRAANFKGPMVLHCHILTHEDAGMMAVVDITGEGKDAESPPDIVDFGTCSNEVPESEPFNGAPVVLPGLIEVEEFDLGGEGVAYHNVNYATLAAPAFRPDEAVEIVDNGDIIYISRILKSEFLKYTVEAEKTGDFVVHLTQSSVDPMFGMQISLWVDVDACPPAGQLDGYLGRIMNPEYTGTGAYNTFEDVYFPDAVTFTEGVHKLLLCFEVNAFMNLDSITFEACDGDCEIPL